MNNQDHQYGWNLALAKSAELSAHDQKLRDERQGALSEIQALKERVSLLSLQIEAAEAETARHNAFVVALRDEAIKAGVNQKYLQVV